MTLTVTLALTLALSQIEGCRAPAGTRSVVRDSAGVRIVENYLAPDFRLPHIFVESLPDVTAQVPNEGRLLTPGARLSDGSFAVVESWPRPRIRLFASDGRLIRILIDPGNDRSIFGWNVQLYRTAGDTLILSDVDNRRLTFITPTGGIVRVLQLPPRTWAREPDGPPSFAGVLPSGALLGIRILRPPESRTDGRPIGANPPLWRDTLPVVWRDTLHLHQLRSDTTWEDAVALRGDLNFISFVDRASGSQPFTVESSISIGPDGLYHSVGQSYSIDRYRNPRQRDLIVRLCRERNTLTPAEVRRYQDSVVAGAISDEARLRAAQRVRALPYPTHWPPFTRLHADASGRLWVREPGPGAANQWLVYSRDGVLEATATLPSLVMYLDDEFLLNGFVLYRLRVIR